MPRIECTTCDDSEIRRIGEPGASVDVYAFRGGAGIDSVFQLGVAHAHIVADLPRPQLLVGISTGAVHAAATAEVLQAPGQLPEEHRQEKTHQRSASLSRFREILYAYQSFATDLESALPDAFEAGAGRSLLPNPQAIHFKDERDSRLEALRARSGLIALINDLFDQTITIRTITRVVRGYLGWRATAEMPFWKRLRARLHEPWYLTKALVSAPLQCLRLAKRLLHAWVGGSARIERRAILKWSDSWLRTIPDLFLRPLEGRHSEGYTAGQIIFGGRRPRLAPHILVVSTALIGAVAVLVAVAGSLEFHMRGFFWTCVMPAAAVFFACMYSEHREEINAARKEIGEATNAERILAYYDLERDLGNDYTIEDLLIRIFDPSYHGKIDMADVAKRAMTGDDEPPEKPGDQKPRTFELYATANFHPLHVVPFVADLKKGDLTRINEDNEIVGGLCAAVAKIPFLRPIENEKLKTFLADAANVSNDAVFPSIDVLRLRLDPEVKQVRIFSVSSVTLRESENPPTYRNTIDVLKAGLELSRFRDASAERELINFYHDLIPESARRPERLTAGIPRALVCFGSDKDDIRHFVRAELATIEPEVALHTSGRLLQQADKQERQTLIARAVAEGCRATLAVRRGINDQGCRAMLGMQRVRPRAQGVLDPNDDEAPGATEICSHCKLYATPRAPRIEVKPADPPVPPAAELPQPPTVNLLLSGGVFRGVFQIGVVNALNELGAKPDVIGGSSVGSVVAAMIARIFNTEKKDRHLDIVRLASTFMTLDRLVITDRFADFVRRFTLRAAEARFSLRDADLFFRNYGAYSPEFDAVARRVVAGIEHLFYVSPYELSELVKSIRHRDYATTYELFCRYAQEIFDRGLVGFELLGAEPLALLIRQHVLQPDQHEKPSHALLFRNFAGKIQFLATATNLTTRELRIIGPGCDGMPEDATLIDALLASSAFPGVFRPRWSREIFASDNSIEQYIDGGVLDNLPLSAVVRHLNEAARRGEIAFRPYWRERNQPHLVFTASLEPATPPLDDEEVARMGRSWLAARERAQRLRYNQKIDRFAKVQRDLTFIYNTYSTARGTPVGLETLDIDVVVVKPRWLCGTFAFHPMLGFRRRKQAASIAHGCAATFGKFADIAADETRRAQWPEGWGLNTADIEPDAKRLHPHTRDKRAKGQCHFRSSPEAKCPFSSDELQKIPNTEIDEKVKKNISEIYRLCGLRSTHEGPE